MRRLIPALMTALTLALLAGCVTLPDEGPVQSGPAQPDRPDAGTFDYNPAGPRAGDDPADIVAGFLDSLRETPLTYAVSRSFLTTDASQDWAPSTRTIVYDDGSLDTSLANDDAEIAIESSVQLDSRGSWLGDPTEGQGLDFELHLVQQNGEWRIADPPDALIVSRSHFDTRFVRYDLHFFDPSARVLVPEPVYLPAGDQTPGLLVSGLLAGPDPQLRSVERTFFPAGTRLELIEPVSNGVVDIPLSDEVLDTDSGQLDLAMAQLAWTLRQVPGIEKMRVTVDGAPVDRTTGASARSLLAWSQYDPAVSGPSNDLFAVRRGGFVVSMSDDGAITDLTDSFRPDRIGSIGVSMGAGAGGPFVSAVTRDGRRVLSAAAASGASPTPPRQVYAGTDVLRPAYDIYDNWWLVDRTASGARLLVGNGNKVREVRAPDLTGKNVTAFEISRDGTRLAAIVDGSVVLARIARSSAGRPTELHPAAAVPFGSSDRAIDLAWTSPATLGVLVRLGPNTVQVLRASVDGSYAVNADAASLEPLFERVDDLITWPGADAPIYLRGRLGELYSVSPTGHWTTVSLPPGLTAPVFRG